MWQNRLCFQAFGVWTGVGVKISNELRNRSWSHFLRNRSRSQKKWLRSPLIRTIANFVEFGLDLDYKRLQNLGTGPDLDWVKGKETRHFCCEKAAFFESFGLHLDLDITFAKSFGLWLDLDRVLKNQDWIWIAKYDSPLISAKSAERTTVSIFKWRDVMSTILSLVWNNSKYLCPSLLLNIKQTHSNVQINF